MRRSIALIVAILAPLALSRAAHGQGAGAEGGAGTAKADTALRREAAEALRRAVMFFRTAVSSDGGYVYRYSADLAKREGEGEVGTDTVWVQPPGTPTVGMALLDAYERVREPYLLEAARAAGECLVRGQLRSGGWTDRIELGEQGRRKFAYRLEPPGRKRFNWSTLDDDKTQSAVRFVCRLDRATGFADARIHEAAVFAVESIATAQFPNGAWPQGFEAAPEAGKYPVKRASFPKAWPRQHPGGDYWIYYTFNDGAIADTIDAMLVASEVYSEPRYRAAAIRGGEFILLAQMPEPQPAWAQQYNFDMHPAWARKFEPPAISGSESQGLIRTLLRLFVETGERRFLEPVPAAIAYLRRSLLPDGRLARFYELETNRPLYFNRRYELTHDDGDLPTHYSFKVANRLDELDREYRKLAGLTPIEVVELREARAQREPDVPTASQVRSVVGALDDRGAWVEAGRLKYHGNDDDTRRVIESATFIQNVGVLSRYVSAGAQRLR